MARFENSSRQASISARPELSYWMGPVSGAGGCYVEGFGEGVAGGPLAQEARSPQMAAVAIHFERANPAIIMAETPFWRCRLQPSSLTRLSGFITRSAFPIPN